MTISGSSAANESGGQRTIRCLVSAIDKSSNKGVVNCQLPRPDTLNYFVRPLLAQTAELRIRGYRQALVDCGIDPGLSRVHVGMPEDRVLVSSIVGSGADALICSNDMEAAMVMSICDDMGIGIPDNLLIAGFDDVRFAQHLRVPLTTYHQPCREIGITAIRIMLIRIEDPSMPARHIILNGHMVPRRSAMGIE